MATKPKAILSTHDGRESSPITRASNVLFENGQTAQDILNDRQDAMISPVIENSSSMFKVGQGDDVDYSANVVNGAYESMVLKGKSMVNCIQESSSKDVVLPYEFEEGRYVTINDTKESGALGVELKGQTLKSLYTKTFTLDPKTQYSQLSVAHDKIQIELNKEYTIMIDVYKNNSNCPLSFNTYGHNITPTNGLRFNAGETGRKIAKVVFTSKQYARWFWFETSIADTTATDSIQCEITVVDGNYVDVVHSHFEGLISCKMPTLSTKNNLFDGRMEIGGYNIGTGTEENHQTTRIRCVDFIPINNPSNTTMEIINSQREDDLWILQYDSNKNHLGGSSSFNIPRGVCKQKLNLDSNCAFIKFYEVGVTRLDLGIEYIVSDKTSILSLPEEVVLRGIPNGVCDVFNAANGILAKKTQEVVLNGVNERWTVEQGNVDHITGNAWFKASLGEPISYLSQGIVPSVADKLATHNINIYAENRTAVGICIENHIAEGELRLQMNLPQALIGGTSIEDLKNYLKQNPVTIVVPSNVNTTKINLPSTLKSWNTTTHIYSEIPENSLYPILSHSNPTYPVILKPSTKYSIVANSYSNGHTNSAINFNLGGATASTTVGSRVTTITTPSTLSNELLTMSGRGNKLNNVMVIEGVVAGDLPYFEGLCDSKSPILSNCGKNLVNLDKSNPDDLGYDSGYGTSAIVYDDDKQGFYTKTNRGMCANLAVKPNTYYTISADFLLRDNNGYSFLWQNPTQSAGDTYNSSDFSPTEWRRKSVTRLSDENGKINWVVYGAVYFKNLQVEEGTTATPYEPYKSNILSCNGDKIELTEDMFEQGTTAQYSANIGKTYQWMKENSTQDYNTRRLRTKSLIKIEPNTKLILQNTDNFMYAIGGYGVDKLSLGTFDTGWVQNTTITIPQDVYYISFVIRKKDDTSIAIDDFKNTNFTLSEVDKTIVLRSLPDGTCDTLNVETGEYVQRIGEVVLDGTKRFGKNMPESEYNKPCVRVSCTNALVNGSSTPQFNMKADKIAIGYYSYDRNYPVMAGLHEQALYIYIPRTIIGLTTNDNNAESIANAFNSWLTRNPITVQYPLATPIVSTIDIQGFPYAYTNGHVQLSSGSIEQSLTPKVEYSVATNRNGQIRSNQKMVERHQKQLDQLQAIILANLVNSQYNQTLTTLKYELSRV